MNKLSKHPGHAQAGLEYRILRKIPHALLASIVVPLLCILLVYWLTPDLEPVQLAKHQQLAVFLAIAIVLTCWSALLTLTIGCVCVYVMKGPAYVADRYDLIDSDRPIAGHETENKQK